MGPQAESLYNFRRRVAFGHLKRLKRTISVIRLFRNWPTASLDRAHLLPRIPILYRLRNGVTFLVTANTLERGTINEIWIDGIYTPSSYWDIQPDWTVVDLGAHKGIFSIYAALRAKEVWAVEANPWNHAVLLANLSINGLLDKVKTFEGVIGNTDGLTELHIYSESLASSSLARDDFTPKGIVTVPGISISRFFSNFDNVDLVKMDIEGGEYDVILSAESGCWLHKVRRIAVEYHVMAPLSSTPDQLNSRLRDLDFQITVKEEDRKMLYAERS